MPHSFDPAPFEKEIRKELERIGVGDGLAVDGPVTPEELLAALRATSDGAGSQALFANLKTVLRRGSEQ